MKWIKFEKIEIPQPNFIENCPVCSKQNEPRAYSYARTAFQLTLWKFQFKFYQRLKIKCLNCGKVNYLPASFARTVFKNGGLKTKLLLKYSNDRLISSWFANFIANSWKMFASLLAIFLIFVMFRYFYEPVLVGEAKEVTFNDLKGNSNLGKIVKVKGKVDYPLAFTTNELVSSSNGETSVSPREVYLPIFSEIDNADFAVIRGGQTDLSTVTGRVGITVPDLLKNQDYEVIGRVETIENIKIEQLKKYFSSDLPNTRALNKPQILINSAEVVTLQDFINRYISIATILLILTVSSVALQIYLDKKIKEKEVS